MMAIVLRTYGEWQKCFDLVDVRFLCVPIVLFRFTPECFDFLLWLYYYYYYYYYQ